MSSKLQQRISELMASRRLSMRELSLAAGMNDTAIKNIMKGKSRHPRIDSVRAIAQALGVSVSELLDVPPKLTQSQRLIAIRLQAVADEITASPAQMADLAQVSERTWQSWVGQTAYPTCDCLITLCNALGWLKLDWLFRGDPEPMPVSRYLRLRLRVEAALEAAGEASDPAPEAGGPRSHGEPGAADA